MSFSIPGFGSGEAYDMPINPASGLAQFLSVTGVVAIPGLGIALGLLFTQLFKKDYDKEIHIFTNVTKPMSEALQRKDFVAATAGIRAQVYKQEPQHTHVVYMIQGWGPEAISRMQPQVQNAMFTAMLGYAIQTHDWAPLKVFNQELQGIDDYSAPRDFELVRFEGVDEPVALREDQEGGIPRRYTDSEGNEWRYDPETNSYRNWGNQSDQD